MAGMVQAWVTSCYETPSRRFLPVSSSLSNETIGLLSDKLFLSSGEKLLIEPGFLETPQFWNSRPDTRWRVATFHICRQYDFIIAFWIRNMRAQNELILRPIYLSK
jgi:hypothetical protein